METYSGKIGHSVKDLLRLLSQALYSSPKVALRELLQNGHDAVVFQRLALAEKGNGLGSHLPPCGGCGFRMDLRN